MNHRRITVRTTNIFALATLLIVAAGSGFMPPAAWWVCRNVPGARSLACVLVYFWPLTSLAILLAGFAAWQISSKVIIDLDAHLLRATLLPSGRKIQVASISIEGFEPIEHVARWFELEERDRSWRLRRTRYDVAIRHIDGSCTRVPLKLTRDEVTALAERLRRTLDEVRMPSGYRE